MAQHKKADFEITEQQLANFAKAIAHPARVAILKTLAQKRVCICGEIVEVLPLAQATVSQHLKELKTFGIVQGEIDGVKSCYCIDWQVFDACVAHFSNFAVFMQSQRFQNTGCDPSSGTCC